MGVQTKNRDSLQRAVGLTCQIDGQDIRSATLCRIINEAAILAAQQGDLDLLLRMKEWCHTLLEKDQAVFALANIIEGVIKYSIDNRSPDALEKACLIAQEIDDLALKAQLFEHIIECFIKIGCEACQRMRDEIFRNGGRYTPCRDQFLSLEEKQFKLKS